MGAEKVTGIDLLNAWLDEMKAKTEKRRYEIMLGNFSINLWRNYVFLGEKLFLALQNCGTSFLAIPADISEVLVPDLFARSTDTIFFYQVEPIGIPGALTQQLQRELARALKLTQQELLQKLSLKVAGKNAIIELK